MTTEQRTEPPTPDEVVSSIDMLMSLDPLDLTEQDLDAIIAYQRRHRHNLEGGAKPTRKALKGAAAAKADGVEDRQALVDLIKASIPKPVVTRRTLK